MSWLLIGSILCLVVWLCVAPWHAFEPQPADGPTCDISAPPKPVWQHGSAAWMGQECQGRLMANGRAFDLGTPSAASWDYPLGTWLIVQHGPHLTVVEVTDHGPSRELRAQGRIIDQSKQAFRQLADTALGVIAVQVLPLDEYLAAGGAL